MPDSHPAPPDVALAPIVQRNIQALIERRRSEQQRRSFSERVADTVTHFTGSMKFVVLHVALFGAWIIANLPGVPLPKFDPSFVILAMFASVEAIFLSTFVLISQNRMAVMADKRADLDLQISLLSEHEITRLIHMVEAITEHLKLEHVRHPELEELKQDVAPEKVLDTIEQTNSRMGA